MKKTLGFILLFIYFSLSLYSEESKQKDSGSAIRRRGSIALSMGYAPKFKQKDENSFLGVLKKEGFNPHDIFTALTVTYDVSFPIFVTENRLTKLNNISLKNLFRISPSHMEGTMELNFTPIAFYNIGLGAGVGTGWIIPGVSNTLAVNNHGVLSQQSFLGPVVSFYISHAISMDFALVFPAHLQQWTHIIARISNQFIYQRMVGVGDYTPWVWGDDEGTNLNGWIVNIGFLLAYKIPVRDDRIQLLDSSLSHRNKDTSIMFGFMFNIDKLNLSHFTDSPMSQNGWGSDFVPVLFTPLVRLELPHDLYINVLIQFSNYPRYSNESFANEIYYQNRHYRGQFFYPKRFIVDVGWKF